MRVLFNKHLKESVPAGVLLTQDSVTRCGWAKGEGMREKVKERWAVEAKPSAVTNRRLFLSAT